MQQNAQRKVKSLMDGINECGCATAAIRGKAMALISFIQPSRNIAGIRTEPTFIRGRTVLVQR